MIQMSVFDKILIKSEYKDGDIPKLYETLHNKRELNKNSDCLSLLKTMNLLKINQFKFKNFLNGGQGAITALYIDDNGIKCVIKFLIAPRYDEEYQNFVSEYGALLNLTHNKFKYNASPKVIINFTQLKKMPIYYFGVEFIEGITLKDLIVKKPIPWNWEEVISLMQRISLALYEINMNRIIHRDLHPGNIIITRENHKCRIDEEEPGIRIIDFGNKVNWGGELFGDEHTGNAFRFEGSITSWSPEYILDRKRDNGIEQDIWSLGVITFLLLTGEYPINVSNISELFIKYKNFCIHMKINLLKDIPEPILYIIKRMLDENPSSRIAIGPLTKVLSDIVHNDILNAELAYLKTYLEYDGQPEDPLDYIY